MSVAPRRDGGSNRPMPGARMMPGMTGPLTKPLNFRGSLRRLLGMLRPDRTVVVLLLLFGVTSVTLSVIGPRLLGHATDLIFSGVISRQMPPGATVAQVVAGLRAHGNGTLASMLSAMHLAPGRGIDFGAIGTVLLEVVAIYIAASIASWLQARLATIVVQRTAFRLREQVEAKLSRLPLSYFDGQPHGEVLSRVTNDIDNVAQTLQQSMSQLVTSVLTVVGVLAMMIVLSPILSIIALVTVPLSILVAVVIAKRAQPQFVTQWATTGRLNGHIEEMYTGHSLVKVFGRHEEAAATFRVQNVALFTSSFRAQLISGVIQPTSVFLGNVNYVLVAVVGGLRVASGAMSLGDVQAFIQYSRQFNQPLQQMASLSNLVQSGIASAERVFELLDGQEQTPEPVNPARPTGVRGRIAFEDVSFRYDAAKRLIEHLSLIVEPGETVAIVGPSGAGKTTLVNLLMRFYDVNSGRITFDGVDIAMMSREEVRENMGMVLQDTWLFGGTIAENIAYGAEDATREQIIEAAQATHVDHLVRTLPDG